MIEDSSITSLLKDEDYTQLAKELHSLNPFEIAEAMFNLSEADQKVIFSLLPQPLKIKTFDFLSVKTQQHLLHKMPPSQAAIFLSSLSPDDRTSLLQDLPRYVIDDLINLLSYKERQKTIALLEYPENSIGRLMTTDYIAVRMGWTIEKVLDHIQAYGHYSETIDYIYVINEDGKLLDDIQLKDLLFIPRNSHVKNVADKNFTALSVNDDEETAINIFRQSSREALPVINEKGILCGIVTIDDILRLSNEEATEDIQKIGGMAALDEPYLQAPFMELMQKRAGWLVILFLGEMLTATALGYFEEEIAKAVVLALFLPLIISSGGNAGSQASTLVIRAMALGEIKLHDWWRIVKREVLSGIFLGVILGVIGFFRITIWSFFSNVYGEHWFLIALTVFFSLIGVVLWGTLSGALFPLILRRIGVDPASASAPFVATVVDVTGVIIYFVIALALLTGTLL